MRVSFDVGNPDPAHLSQAAACVRAGGIVVYPTDTVYGLGCNPFHKAALARLFELKQRDCTQPMLLLIDDLSWAERLGIEVPRAFYDAVKRWWPGPLTIALRSAPGLPAAVTSSKGSVAFRLPAAQSTRKLVAECGFPITSTSVNVASQSALVFPADIWNEWGPKIDLFLDAGTLPAGQPSTVLDLSVVPPRVTRAGQMSTEVEAWIAAGRQVAS